MFRIYKHRYRSIRVGMFTAILLSLVFGSIVSANADVHTTVQEPSLPLRVVGKAIDRAYPGIPYETRLGVQGGQYPYEFEIIKAPDGMEIDRATGVIVWNPGTESGAFDVEIQITDRQANRIHHRYRLEVSKESFRFVAANGSDRNVGTEDSPWATVEHAVKHATNDKYIYVQEGTYPVYLHIQEGDCGKVLAVPGRKVTLMGGRKDDSVISVSGPGDYVFQGFDCDANGSRWFFAVDSSLLSNLTIRKNRMFNIQDDSLENPAFLFFRDSDKKPILGQVHYKDILFQENIVHALRSSTGHGASATLYNVQDMIFEDNLVYDIDGNGITDKDDGFRNTFRNNVIYDCERGMVLANQQTQGTVDIHHNLIYNCPTAVAVGWQPGYLKDVFIHHNTLLGSIVFGSVLHDNRDASNINVYNNILGDGNNLPYQFIPIEKGDGYMYPSYVHKSNDDTVRIDRNLIRVEEESPLAGYEWGLPSMNRSEWQNAGYDRNSVIDNLPLDANASPDPGHTLYGMVGRDNRSVSFPLHRQTEEPEQDEEQIQMERSLSRIGTVVILMVCVGLLVVVRRRFKKH